LTNFYNHSKINSKTNVPKIENRSTYIFLLIQFEMCAARTDIMVTLLSKYDKSRKRLKFAK